MSTRLLIASTMSTRLLIASTTLFSENGFYQKREKQSFMQEQHAIMVASKKEEQQKQQQNLKSYRFLNSNRNDYKRNQIQDNNKIQQPLKKK